MREFAAFFQPLNSAEEESSFHRITAFTGEESSIFVVTQIVTVSRLPYQLPWYLDLIVTRSGDAVTGAHRTSQRGPEGPRSCPLTTATREAPQ